MPPALVEVPKRSGDGVRRLVLLGPADAADYERAVAPLVSLIEASLDPGVIANRVLPVPGVVRFEPWRRALRRHRRLLGRLQADVATSGSLMVHADVRDCYASIGPEAVARTLLELGGHPSVVGRLVDLLDRLRPPGVTGLPVGPDPSAVLANAVLRPVDQAVRRAGGRSLRWVDDFAVAAPDRPGAERILEALAEALGRLGLSPSPHKTGIREPADPTAGSLSPIWSPDRPLL